MKSKFFALCALLLTLTVPAWAANIDVNSSTILWTQGNTYVVNGGVGINSRVFVNGSVTLILNDYCTLGAGKASLCPGAAV